MGLFTTNKQNPLASQRRVNLYNSFLPIEKPERVKCGVDSSILARRADEEGLASDIDIRQRCDFRAVAAETRQADEGSRSEESRREEVEEGKREMRRIYTAFVILDLLLLLLWLCADLRPL